MALRLKAAMHWWVAVAFAFGLFATGCSKSAGSSKNPNEKRFPLRGEVLAVDVEHAVLTVKHEEIKDYMPAMTMEFSVSPGDAANAKAGQQKNDSGEPHETGHELIPPETSV